MIEYFRLYANCIIVEGYNESIICDIEYAEFVNIPNSFAQFLNQYTKSNLGIHEYLENEFPEISSDILKFLHHLQKIGIGQFTNFPEIFSELSLEWDSPFKLSNAIIEHEFEKNYEIINVINQLDEIGCRAIELRLLKGYSVEALNLLMSNFNKSRVQTFIIYIDNNIDDIDQFIKLFNENGRIHHIKIFGRNYKVNQDQSLIEFRDKILIYKTKLIPNHSEEVQQDNFVINMESFTEAQSFNIGLNRKICISFNGEIKSHLSHSKSYGNVNHIKTNFALKELEQNNYWRISNDLIVKCKDCQFRYMCSDNSDIIIRNKKFEKIKTCNFNPYENNWTNI